MELHGDKLKEIRKKKKITAEELADKLGVTRVTISAWENGKRVPSELKTRRLAKSLNVSVEDISDLCINKEISKVALSTLTSSISILLSRNELKNLNSHKNLVSGINDIIKEITDASVIVKAILSFLPSIFYIKGSDLKYITSSDEFLKILSLNKDFELLGITDFTLFPQKEAIINSELDSKVLATGESILNIETYIPGTRKNKWGIMSKIPIFDLEGKIEGILGFFVDITEKKNLEKKIQLEREFKQALVEKLPVAVIACDADGMITLFNNASVNWHGMDAIKIPQEKWAEHYNLCKSDGTTPLSLEDIPLIKAFHGETFEEEITIVQKDQPLRHIIANGATLYDKNMNKLGAVVSMTDTTDLNEYQTKLQRMNEELHLYQLELKMQNDELRLIHAKLDSDMKHYFDLYDLAPIGLITLNKQCLILEGNITASDLIGINKDSLCKQTFTSFVFQEDQDIFYFKYREVWKNGVQQKCVIRMIKPDGSTFQVYLQATLSNNDNCSIAFMNITEMKTPLKTN